MDVFSDPRKNNAEWMKKREATLAKEHPEFVEAAEKLYQFQRDFLKAWGVRTNLVSAETAKEWGERWQYYVPFQRYMGDQFYNTSAKRGFANQKSPYNKARGSTRDIIHPVDSIINNIIRNVNVSVRNDVFLRIAQYVERKGANALWLEKIPPKLAMKTFNLAPVKEATIERLWDIMPGDVAKIGEAAINMLDDLIIQYGRGKAFGNFEKMLVDVPEPLGETIPDFHNMELRMRQLREAVANDAAGRLDEVRDIVDELERDADEMCQAERLYREGRLPKRICHCDTKVNNMLFDRDGQVLCVIDLDTVMPSFIFSDYGDFLRTGANFTAEDDPDLSRVGFNEEIFKSFTTGYLESARDFLTPIEIEMLPYAVALFPFMQCVRFLADYINGDTYYKIKYPTHNLDRTRNQLALYLDVRRHDQMMTAFIQGLL